jgi:membrane protease YdiL (CAAX protease family)
MADRASRLYQILPLDSAVAPPGWACELSIVRGPASSASFSRRLVQPNAPRSGTWIAVAYCALGAIGATIVEAFGQSPITTPPWLGQAGPIAAIESLALGVLVAVVTVRTTRVLGRAGWARALHADLRPIVHGLGDGEVVLMAVASGVGEELFFRGCLTPLFGILLSSVAFGVVHQVRGRARWAWACWATVMGVAFATIYRLTGHLEGPIASHVAINLVNLRYLRDHDPKPKPRTLGGLLAR